MINHLDNLLRDMFVSQIRRDASTGEPIFIPDPNAETDPILTSDDVGFRPPDNHWRDEVNTLGENDAALNIYLFDVRENRKLRTNE
jgi:hypothetical protein